MDRSTKGPLSGDGPESGPAGRPGVPAWFVTFFEENYADLVGAALLVGGALDEHEARDAVQDVVVGQIQRGIWDVSNPGAYFRTAVVRRVLDRHRQRRRHRLVELVELGDADGQAIPAAAGPDMNVWADEQWVKGLLGALPPWQETVMRLVYEGLTCEEIAEILGGNPNTVRSHLRHARRRLAQALLTGHGPDDSTHPDAGRHDD